MVVAGATWGSSQTLLQASRSTSHKAPSRASSSGLTQVQPVTPQDQEILYQAEQVLYGRCLQQHGYRYWPEPDPDSPASLSARFPYVIDNVAWAEKNGFGPKPVFATSDDSDLQDPNDRYVAGLSSKRLQELGPVENGYGPGTPGVLVTLPGGQVVGHSIYGCTATSEGELYGSFPKWFRADNVVEALPSLWQADVTDSSEFKSAVSAWGRCMRSDDEPYATPAAAASHFLNEQHTWPRQAVIQAAVDEANCANSTELSKVANQLNSRYQNMVESKYSTDLIAYRELAHAALTRAESIVAKTGTDRQKLGHPASYPIARNTKKKRRRG